MSAFTELDPSATDLSLAALVGDPGRHYYGVYPAVVTDNQDPNGEGRVRIRLPWAPDPGSAEFSPWARLATLNAGNNRGSWFVPEVDDEVLVGFGGGDPRDPYVVGSLWNGRDSAPEKMDADNNVRSLTSRSGIKITLDDTRGSVTLTLTTPGGQQVELTDAGNKVTVSDSNGNSLELAPGGVSLTAASKLSISAPTINIDCGSANVTSAMWSYSGVIQCSAAIATSVVGTSYTPGAGNIW